MPVERRLRTLVVDDEKLAVERLQMLCAQLDGVELVGPLPTARLPCG